MPNQKDRIGFAHDYLKHIATLSSAAIAVSITMLLSLELEKITAALSIFSFVLALLFSVVCQVALLANYPIGIAENKNISPKYVDGPLFSSLICFLIGMGLLATSGVLLTFLGKS